MKRALLFLPFLAWAIAGQAQQNYDPDMIQQNRNDDMQSAKSVKEREAASLANFILSDGRIFWQYVFDSAASIEETMAYFKSHDFCGKMGIGWDAPDGNTLYGTHYGTLDYKPYEVNVFGTPGYLMSSPCHYCVQMDFKDGRYRVTVSNIRFDDAAVSNVMIHSLTGTSGAVKENWHTLEQYSLEGDGYNRSFRKNAAIILNYLWIDEYTMTEKSTTITGDDW